MTIFTGSAVTSGTGPRGPVPAAGAGGGPDVAGFNPAGYLRDVRQEIGRVTWPSRKETLITTGLVLALSALAAVFFLVVDWAIQLVMRLLFGFG